MSTFIRASKFRHVFCENPRPDAIFSNLRPSVVTGEQSYIKANELFFATGIAGKNILFDLLCLYLMLIYFRRWWRSISDNVPF